MAMPNHFKSKCCASCLFFTQWCRLFEVPHCHGHAESCQKYVLCSGFLFYPVFVRTRSQLRGEGSAAEAVTLRDGDRAIGGLYEIFIAGGNGSGATVAAGASAASARAALVDGLGLPPGTDVTRSGPLDDSLAYTWTVTLPKGTSLFSREREALGELLVDGSRLLGQGAYVNVSLVSVGVAPLEGVFNISIGREEWTSLLYNASALEFEQAIESFSTSGGNVHVSRQSLRPTPGNTSKTGAQWTLTFSALSAAGDVPMIKVNASGLTGTGVEVFAGEIVKGVTADIQQVAIDGYRGTFSLFVGHEPAPNSLSTNSSSNAAGAAYVSSSVEIPWNATSSELAMAVLEATGSRAYVERSPVNIDRGGYVWLVLFAEALSGTWGTLTLNSSRLIPDQTLLGGSYPHAKLTSVKNSTATAIGGGFKLGFGQQCDEQASGVYCGSAQTRMMQFDSSADEVTAALESLPTVLDATVHGGGSGVWHGIAKTAPDDFGVASAGVRFRVTLTSIVLNASDSAVAEYWHRTWSPDDAAVEWSGDLATGGDLPLLDVDVVGMTGSSPKGRAEEVRKGLSAKAAGVVAVEVSQNAGRDYTSSGVTYVYEPLIRVHALVPDHGPVYGGTEVRRVCHSKI